MLESEKHLLRCLIHSDSERPMRSVQFPVGGHVALGRAIKDYQRIHRVIVDCVDVAVFGVNVETALKLDLRIQSSEDSFRFRETSSRRSVGRAVIDQNLEKVLIGQNNFVIDRVNRHGAIRCVGIADRTHWFKLRTILRRGVPGCYRGSAGVLALL